MESKVNLYYLSPEGIERLRNGAREWVAQYMCEPVRLPSGVYCARCSHTDPMYLDRMVPGRKGKQVPCCGNKHCGCTDHMTAWFEIPERAEDGAKA